MRSVDDGENFDDKGGLADEIRNFAMQRKPAESSADRSELLRPGEIAALAKLLSDWAGFCPDEAHPEAALEVYFRDAPRKVEGEAPSGNSDEDEEDETNDDYEIGILNSFYIDDLEMVMADVAAGRLPEALRYFLTPVTAAERQDLYTADGHKRIVETLMPGRMNRGRWLDDPHQSMSLMQQFAINTAKDRLAEGKRCSGALL